jgi:hypothetical protein
MSSARQTVAACVFQGHAAAGHDCHECPLVQVLMRRVRDLGIDESPFHAGRELDKYRALARVLGCPMLTQVSLPHLARARAPRRTVTNTAMLATASPVLRGS